MRCEDVERLTPQGCGKCPTSVLPPLAPIESDLAGWASFSVQELTTCAVSKKDGGRMDEIK